MAYRQSRRSATLVSIDSRHVPLVIAGQTVAPRIGLINIPDDSRLAVSNNDHRLRPLGSGNWRKVGDRWPVAEVAKGPTRGKGPVSSNLACAER